RRSNPLLAGVVALWPSAQGRPRSIGNTFGCARSATEPWGARRPATCAGERPHGVARGMAPLTSVWRVLAGELGRQCIETFLLALKPCLPAPGALQIVPDVNRKPSELIDFELDTVPILGSVQSTVVRAARQNVAGFQRMQRACPLDAARD